MFELFKKKGPSKKYLSPLRLSLGSLYNGKCFYCDGRINDQSLFANSLVVSHASILTTCLKCRTEGKFDLDTGNIFENRNLNYLITFGQDWSEKIEIMTEYISHIYPSWIDLLLSLRIGYWDTKRFVPGYFYELGFTDHYSSPVSDDDFYKFMQSKFLQEKERCGNFYGKLFSIRECGECGTDWQPRDQSEREVLHNQINESGSCNNCKIPNELQWHMRTDFKMELMSLHTGTL